jgi:hypothetical protein
MLRVAQNAAWIAAFVFLATFVIGMAMTGSSQQTPPNNEKQPAKTESRNTPESKAVADKNTHNEDQKREEKKQWYETFRERPTDWLLVLFNGLLVCATIALFISGEKVADSAKKSAEVAEKTLNQTQRAFVFIKMDGQPMVDAASHALVGYSFYPTAENFGNTPAVNWESYLGGEMFDGEIPDGFDYPPAERGGPLITGSIPPRSKMNAGRGSLGLNYVEMIHKKQKRFFVWGRAKYNDIFEGSPTYHIEYCWEIEFSGTTSDPTRIQIFFKEYPKHNKQYETPRQ